MKILMMTNTYLPIVGGLEKSIKTFTEEFRKKGHKVKIVAPQFKDEEETKPNIVRLPSIQNFNKTDFSVNIPIPGLLEKLFESFEPDVVHAHHPFLVGDLALRLCGQYDIPLVFTYHTMFEQYTDYFALDNEVVRAFVIRLAAGFANLSDQVIVPSESIMEILKKRKVIQPMHVVPTGFDVNFFKSGDGKSIREKYRIKEDAFVLGHLGRLSEEKNLGFLTESLSIALAINPNAYALIVGKGDSKERMQKKFEDCGLMDRVIFTGVLKDQELVDAYHAMDLFVFASLSETQGMVVTEAMSAGVPVVALDAPGVREAVLHNESGKLIKNHHAALFVEAVHEFMNMSKEERSKYSEGALKRAQEFSAENCAEKALKVYEKAVTKKRNPKLDEQPWQMLMNRMKTEWNMVANIGQATSTALKEALLGE